LEIWPKFTFGPLNNLNVSMCTPTNTLPFLTVVNIQINIPNLENVDSQRRIMIIVMLPIGRTCR